MSTVRFERLAEHHIDQVADIEKRCNSAPWSKGAFLNELNNPQSFFLVILVDGKVAGYGGYWRCIDEAHITNISLDSEYRRQGIGRQLMVRLLEQAREEGLWCSTLEVRVSNEPAIKLYESLGFKETARRKHYYPDQEDASVMWLYALP